MEEYFAVVDQSAEDYSFPCSVEDVTIASSLRRYDIVTKKNHYSDPETKKSRNAEKRIRRGWMSHADASVSISVIGVRGRRLIDDPRDRNDVSQDVVSFARVSNFFSRLLVGHSDKLE